MQKYWTFQLAGWLGYSAIGIAINLINGRESVMPLLAGHAAMISLGIGLTHALRRQVHARGIESLWPLLLGGAFAISIALAACVIGLNVLLADGRWDLLSIVALWWGMFLATGIWVLLYARFSERRKLQAALDQARLHALGSQINPHFLFNALNSIRALVEEEPERARDMLTRLSNVLRNCLRNTGEHTVPLEVELEAVSDYLAIETARFADRLHSSVEVDVSARSCHVPPMALQTLVENAIKHGASSTAGPCTLAVRADVRGADLCLTVENDGRITGDRTGKREQVGLRNVRERLQLLYGDRASLRLQDAEGGIVRATIILPAAL